MARGLTITGTTGNVVASGGTLGLHLTGLPNYFVITKVKIAPSGGAGPYNVEIFQKDTLGSSDLMGKWKSITSNVYDPMDFSSGTPAEGNASKSVVIYEDADGTGELHVKFTNNDTSDRTYSYTFVYEESLVADSNRVFTGQKLELLGDVLYFGGRTASQALLKRNGTQVLFRLGDDSAYTSVTASSYIATDSIVWLGGLTASEVSLRRSGTEFHVKLGDSSAFAQLHSKYVVLEDDILFFNGGAATDVRVARSGTELHVKLGDNSGFAQLNAKYVVLEDDILIFNGLAATDIRVARSGTELQVKLGDNSAYAGLASSYLATVGGNVVYFGGSGANDARIIKNGNFTLEVQKGDGSTYGNLLAADLFAMGDDVFFGGVTSSHAKIKRVGTVLAARLGDDSAYAPWDASYFNALSSGIGYYFGAGTSAYPALKRSGTQVLFRLGDDSGYASLTASIVAAVGTGSYLLTDQSIVHLGNGGASEVSLRRSGTVFRVRLGDDSGYASVYADHYLTSASVVFLGGVSASEVSLRRTGTEFRVRLGDDSAYADTRVLNLYANDGNVGAGTLTNMAAFTSFGKFFYVAGNADQYGYVADAAGSSVESPTFLGRKSGGTQASRTNVANGDHLLVLASNGWSGATGYWATAQAYVEVDGTVTDNQRPGSRWNFLAGLPNATPASKLRVDADGTILAVDSKFNLGGKTSSEVMLKRDPSTTVSVRLGDDSDYGDLRARHILAAGSEGFYFNSVGAANDPRINKNGNFTVRIQKGDGSGLGNLEVGDITCATITPGTLNYSFGGFTGTGSYTNFQFADGICVAAS